MGVGWRSPRPPLGRGLEGGQCFNSALFNSVFVGAWLIIHPRDWSTGMPVFELIKQWQYLIHLVQWNYFNLCSLVQHLSEGQCVIMASTTSFTIILFRVVFCKLKHLMESIPCISLHWSYPLHNIACTVKYLVHWHNIRVVEFLPRHKWI